MGKAEDGQSGGNAEISVVSAHKAGGIGTHAPMRTGAIPEISQKLLPGDDRG